MAKKHHYSAKDADTITKIVERTILFFPDRKKQDIRMDILAVHLKTPMRLQEWLDADDFNFIHDIVGIERHLDRREFVLKDAFSPRFLLRQVAA